MGYRTKHRLTGHRLWTNQLCSQTKVRALDLFVLATEMGQ